MRKNNNTNATAPAAMTAPIKKGKGGLRYSREANAKTVQRVATSAPNLTFTYQGMTFNTACVNLFKDCQHVTICIDKENRRLFIQPSEEYDRNSLQFANVKNGRNIPQKCMTPYFCQMLFEFLKWNPNTKYRVPVMA